MNLQWAVAAKFTAAIVLGALIGFEREIIKRPAGVRTHALVAGASCLLMSLKEVILLQVPINESVHADPFALVGAIITGISFIGAGTIIQRGSLGVEGLTTAAALLMSSVVGIYISLGQYYSAVFSSFLSLVILYFLRPLTAKLHPKNG